MLTLNNDLKDMPVMSLRTASRVATAGQPIIDPTKLKIVGFFVYDSFTREMLVLKTEDIREFAKVGLVINDHDVLSPPEDLIRMKDVIENNFDPMGKLVVTKKGRKLGKVSQFALDRKSLFIQRIFYAQPFWRSWSGEKSFARQQIIEITNRKFVIKDTEATIPVAQTVDKHNGREAALRRLRTTPQPQGAITQK